MPNIRRKKSSSTAQQRGGKAARHMMTAAAAAAAASRPERQRNPDHPPYAMMVQAALGALPADGSGATESSISAYISSSFTDLPPAHSRFLPYYLNKILAAGEISSPSPGRYALPSAAAFRRGRGRPRKTPLPPPPPAAAPSPPTPSHRGRVRPCRDAVECDPDYHPKPKLILRLARRPISPEAGDVGHWCCLKDGDDKGSEINNGSSASNQGEGSLMDANGRTSLQAGDQENKLSNGSFLTGNEEPHSVGAETNGRQLRSARRSEIDDLQSNNGLASNGKEGSLETSSAVPMETECEEGVSSPGALASTITPKNGGRSGTSRGKSHSQSKRRRLWFEA